MSLNTPTPPLLLTKRLTAFLNANLSPTLHAAFITTASGKLLAHATTPSFASSGSSPGSPPPPGNGGAATISSTTASPSASSVSLPTGSRPSAVSLLRTQATVAASLFALHSASSTSIPGALPGSSESHLDHDVLPDTTPASPTTAAGGKKKNSNSCKLPLTITVQLSNGILVVRRLRCGLLFVCVGPLPEPSDGASHSHHHHHHHHHTGGSSSAPGEGGSSAGSGTGGGLSVPGTATPRGQQHGNASPAHMPASPSEVDSVMSAGAATTVSVASAGSSVAGSVGAVAVVSMRRHAEDLARWLDDKLGSLRVPQDGVGAVE
ncbi:hypothetical protein SODALDRAFT_335740 [Sodiomyces alkalinus F11]|uniref:Uncharacterized protein n=1 Tax=Sodiomyces alkalinus (strain CBS 110278 / VKM F-3762 / F11) TaxID=1314773 RepID=A0A3N2PQ50_SODAK|nr:hypothetical protein SODALDRAFT_335740 [Sodiomyces alkalinus F11]ROT36637.1 hypothetical protein SODALDRAFT_335740 [Sodiomyces alkalinus F11]